MYGKMKNKRLKEGKRMIK
jgi:hypothetical protein